MVVMVVMMLLMVDMVMLMMVVMVVMMMVLTGNHLLLAASPLELPYQGTELTLKFIISIVIITTFQPL